LPDEKDRIRRVDSPIVVVTASLEKFMEDAGDLLRPAYARDERSQINEFFTGKLDASVFATSQKVNLSPNTVSVKAIDLGKSTDVLEEFVYQHVNYQVGTEAWKRNTFIWNSVPWKLDPETTFELTLDANGHVVDRKITNLKFIKVEDNYDYETADPTSSALSKFLHGKYHDPFNLGKRFEITFDAESTWDTTQGPNGETWTTTKFNTFKQQGESWYDSTGKLTWGLQGQAIASELSGTNGPLKYQIDGHAVIFGTGLGDEIATFEDLGFCSYVYFTSNANYPVDTGDILLFPLSYTNRTYGDYVFAGFGKDTLYYIGGEIQYDGGEDNDTIHSILPWASGASDLAPDDTHLKFLGGSGYDTIHYHFNLSPPNLAPSDSLYLPPLGVEVTDLKQIEVDKR
jgi:hypothetical protein